MFAAEYRSAKIKKLAIIKFVFFEHTHIKTDSKGKPFVRNTQAQIDPAVRSKSQT